MKSQRDSRKSERGSVSSGAIASESSEDAMAISMQELAEFLQADVAEIEVDLEFKYSLRERLWALVQARNRQRGRTGGA